MYQNMCSAWFAKIYKIQRKSTSLQKQFHAIVRTQLLITCMVDQNTRAQTLLSPFLMNPYETRNSAVLFRLGALFGVEANNKHPVFMNKHFSYLRTDGVVFIHFILEANFEICSSEVNNKQLCNRKCEVNNFWQNGEKYKIYKLSTYLWIEKIYYCAICKYTNCI